MSSLAGTSSDSVAAESVPISAFSNAVGRIEISLRGESLAITLANAFPAYKGRTNVSGRRDICKNKEYVRCKGFKIQV